MACVGEGSDGRRVCAKVFYWSLVGLERLAPAPTHQAQGRGDASAPAVPRRTQGLRRSRLKKTLRGEGCMGSSVRDRPGKAVDELRCKSRSCCERFAPLPEHLFIAIWQE